MQDSTQNKMEDAGDEKTGSIMMNPPPSRAEIAGVSMPERLVMSDQQSTALTCHGQSEYPEQQKLPIAPVLLPMRDEHKEMLPLGDWGDDYFIQQKQFTDDELMMVYNKQIQDRRQGRCTECGKVSPSNHTSSCWDACPECGALPSTEQTRKGTAKLPTPTLRARPWEFRNVRHFVPDMPSPSSMQQMQRNLEHERRLRIQATIRLQQEMHLRRISQLQLSEPPPVQGNPKRMRTDS